MGTIEVNSSDQIIRIKAHVITYGDLATYELTQQLAEEIDTLWNEPNGTVALDGILYQVRFDITHQYNSLLAKETILLNTNPINNFFRIEDFINGNISMVDGIGSNSGYLLIDNLYKGSTTMAHEFGHTLGLVHPIDTNCIGKGVPGIMYPRGTLVDPQFQYDVNALPGKAGGTLYPIHRKVKQEDIDNLRLDMLIQRKLFIIGRYTNRYHEKQIKPTV